MNEYNKPKDRYIAAAFVVLGFILIPFMILKAVVVNFFCEILRDLRREFKDGFVGTARWAHAEFLKELSYKRARRTRLRREAGK